MVGQHLDREKKEMARNKILPKCPVTVKDINNEKYIFGTDISGIRLNKVRRKTNRVYTMVICDNTYGFIQVTHIFYAHSEFYVCEWNRIYDNLRNIFCNC